MHDKPYFITADGLEKLRAELRELKTVKKREIAERIERAKELGDLSENAEYADAKDEMAFVEGRILELEDSVNRAVIIERRENGTVQVGSTVVVRNGGAEKRFAIVGPSEADPAAGRISNETPLAQALLGKKIGDQAEMNAPSGKIVYTIVSVE
ncbi:transcription elongation factor GreA [Patescibacteria group bacterium]|nr:MAG: transcription elongation factor GreA [Patescibacteria group bacterium]